MLHVKCGYLFVPFQPPRRTWRFLLHFILNHYRRSVSDAARVKVRMLCCKVSSGKFSGVKKWVPSEIEDVLHKTDTCWREYSPHWSNYLRSVLTDARLLLWEDSFSD